MSEYSIALERQLEILRIIGPAARTYWRHKDEMAARLNDPDHTDYQGTAALEVALERGDTYFVDSDIQSLLTSSALADGIETYQLDNTRMPSRAGFIWFANPLVAEPDEDGDFYHGLAWVLALRGKRPDGSTFSTLDGDGRLVDPYERSADGTFKLAFAANALDPCLILNAVGCVRPSPRWPDVSLPPNITAIWEHGTILKDALAACTGRYLASGEVDLSATSGSRVVQSVETLILRLFPAFGQFIEQRILTSVKERAPRGLRRRYQAMRSDSAPLINVIQLRRMQHAGGDPRNEAAAIGYSCQWLVRGHWRNQWYPKLNRHQPKWITPYVKGPDDKPLKQPRATVFAVVR